MDDFASLNTMMSMDDTWPNFVDFPSWPNGKLEHAPPAPPLSEYAGWRSDADDSCLFTDGMIVSDVVPLDFNNGLKDPMPSKPHHYETVTPTNSIASTPPPSPPSPRPRRPRRSTRKRRACGSLVAFTTESDEDFKASHSETDSASSVTHNKRVKRNNRSSKRSTKKRGCTTKSSARALDNERLDQQRRSRARLSSMFSSLYEICNPGAPPLHKVPVLRGKASNNSQQGIIKKAGERIIELQQKYIELERQAQVLGVQWEETDPLAHVKSNKRSRSRSTSSSKAACSSNSSTASDDTSSCVSTSPDSSINFRSIFSNWSTAGCLTNASGSLISFNPAFAKLCHLGDVHGSVPLAHAFPSLADHLETAQKSLTCAQGQPITSFLPAPHNIQATTWSVTTPKQGRVYETVILQV